MLVPQLVSRDNLMIKKINGNPVTGSGLLDLFKVSVCVCVYVHSGICVMVEQWYMLVLRAIRIFILQNVCSRDYM